MTVSWFNFICILAATAYYEIVGEHSHLTKAKLFAARSVLARRQAPSPEAHENTTVRVSYLIRRHW